MTTTTPIISIILPVYNQGESLERAIQSVLKQTISNWQLIIVNDGSTDNTKKIAKKYSEENFQIIFLDLDHFGASSAINSGYKLSKGSYITTLDADDYYHTNHLEANMSDLLKNTKIDLLMSKTEILGSPYVVDIEAPEKMIHLDECAIGGTFFVKYNVYSKVGGRPPIQFGSDYYFAKNVLKAGYTIFKVDRRTYVYDRTGNISITKNEEKR